MFEQFLPIATYMADARAQELPLLTVGDSDDVIHDWNYMITVLGVIDHDVQIAHSFRVMVWIGMLAGGGVDGISAVCAPARPKQPEFRAA